MKKYILKKDLPILRAGAECYVSGNGHLFSDENGNDKGRLIYTETELAEFPNILTDWFEGIPEKPKTVWDLEDGDECWLIQGSVYGMVASKTHWRKNLEEDRSVGNVGITEKECIKEIAWRKARTILMRDTKGFKPNLEEKAQAFEVDYDCDNKVFECDVVLGFITHNGVFFRTKEDGEESIIKHEKEWKIYLGVTE